MDVKHHIDLMAEQGRDVSDLRPRFGDLSKRIPKDRRQRSRLWKRLEKDVLAAESEWHTDEPSELEEILSRRPSQRVDIYDTKPAGPEIADRIAGGWYGRIAGCILGKPVECLMKESDSRAKLRELLENAGEYPMRDFVSEKMMVPYWETSGANPSWFHGGNPSLREYIKYAPVDDDLNYTVLSLKIVAEHGRAFGPDQVLDTWLRSLTFAEVCTAEKIAYRNRVLGLSYPRTATFMNPYREWIGAQIRTDLYGYISPGMPEAAARMAWADAAASHTKNGIYGGMWVAAALAAAYMETDPEAVIRRGLEQVPENSRFAEHMLRTIDSVKSSGDDFQRTFHDIQSRVGHYHCVHTVNNACVVAAALLHGGRDFGRVICTAVMGGLDTDCNGATAGSIAGVMLGEQKLPGKWKKPFNDELRTGVKGYHSVRISGLVQETRNLM